MTQLKEMDQQLVAAFLKPYRILKVRVLQATEKTKKILENIQVPEQLSLLVSALKMIVPEESKEYFEALLYGFNQTKRTESVILYETAQTVHSSLISEELLTELLLLKKVSDAESRGFTYDEANKKYNFNANAFVRHFNTRCHIKSTKDGRLFFYNSKGVYEELSDVERGKIIRTVMHEGLWNSWRSSYEKEVVKALLREAVVVEEMNNEKNFINLSNGLLDLKRFELVPHSPKYLSTVQLPMAYNFYEQAPNFSLFIQAITLADKPLMRVLQEVVGYLISGETKAEKAFYFYGGGANGKSVLASVITKLVGKENVSSIPLADFGQRFGLEGLINKTINIAAENELSGQVLKTENFKAIVSGDIINIELKFRPSISYKPHCKLVFLVNNLPDSKDVTSGYFRKLMIVPFRRTFKPKERNINLLDELMEELPGILNWALEGLRRLQTNNYQFSECAVIEQAHDAYYLEQNPIKAFFSEHIQMNSGSKTKQADFHEMYKKWLELQGIDDKGTRSNNTFWRYFKIILENAGIPLVKKKIKGTIYLEGLEIVGLEKRFPFTI
ncbi:DNA primase family protein [Lysinibacillus sphaericus]|uniref:DNA primase family protein n=1 Tax=Lysinibacillus sphaericus TaxID=1421 RepID=UPI001CBDBE80|nr:phage/plasmid primase, P4 family [Lysinibacillus sphaericus]